MRTGVACVPPVLSVHELTAAWCEAALASVLLGRVAAAVPTPIGTGQMAGTFRLRLTYDPPGGGPPSVVVKTPAAAPSARAAARVTRSYETEVGFYRQLASALRVRAPHCYYAAHDPTSGAYTVVLEDLGGARCGDQLAGCSFDEIAAATVEMARLHASGQARRGSVPEWLPRHDGPSAEHMASLVRTVTPRFLRRYGERLSDDVVGLVERFASLVAPYLCDRIGPRTVVHGDFRADNLLFGDDGVTVIDWQTAACEPGLVDLSYFLGGSVPSARRRSIEADIVTVYREALNAFGVALSDTDCHDGCRRYALGGLLTAIVASALVGRTERGDEMFAVMVERHGRHALDLGAEAFYRH